MPTSTLLYSVLGFIAILVIAALIAAAATGNLRQLIEALFAPPKDRLPSYRKQHLLSAAELRLLGALEQAAPELSRTLASPIRIYTKIRLADLIMPDIPRSQSKAWMSAFAKISQKHADFVLAAGPDVLCVIELDDRSHNAPKQRAKDQEQDRALATAGLPTVRINVRRSYNPQEIASTVVHSITQPQPASAARSAARS